MSRYPSATWKPIRDTSTSRLTKDILCLHTMVGNLNSVWPYFDRLDIQVYSHFGVGGIWGSDASRNLDGVVWQMAETDYRAAANLNGNYRVISVETADNATRPIAPWTPKQCDALVRIMVDAHRLDGIPLVLIPDSKPGRRGVAYHRLGCDPYRASGGELWSSSVGKDCPTQARIDQIPGLLARAVAIVNGTQEEDPMAGITIDQIKAAVKDVVGDATYLLMYGDDADKVKDTGTHPNNLQQLREDLTAVNGRLDALEAKVTPTPPAGA